MNTYEKGLLDEAKTISWLGKHFDKVRKSSKHEDMNLDIDCWVGDLSLSIKAQHIALKTGNLAFELEVEDRHTGKFQKSWYYNGEAKGYLIMVGDALYMVNKQSLAAYVQAHGWDSIRGLTQKTKQMQDDIGHRHTDVKVGLVKLTKMVAVGVAKRLNK